jgi:hypothetical protein
VEGWRVETVGGGRGRLLEGEGGVEMGESENLWRLKVHL